MYLELAQRMAAKWVELESAAKGDAKNDDTSQSTDRKDAETAADFKAVTWIFRSFLTRPPNENELVTLQKYFDTQLERLTKGELKASQVGGEGASARQAALAMVARVVMNLDETMTKR